MAVRVFQDKCQHIVDGLITTVGTVPAKLFWTGFVMCMTKVATGPSVMDAPPLIRMVLLKHAERIGVLYALDEHGVLPDTMRAVFAELRSAFEELEAAMGCDAAATDTAFVVANPGGVN